jgi:hypothetical protein
VATSHVVPNQWLAEGGYDGPPALAKLEACAASIVGGVGSSVHHDKVKGSVKEPLRELARRLGCALLNHKQLRKQLVTELAASGR